MSKKRAPKGILSLKRAEVTDVCRKLHNWELNDFCWRVNFFALKYSVVQKCLYANGHGFCK